MTYLSGKHPFVKLGVDLPKGGRVDINCLIDTGFSGGLALPKEFQSHFPQDELIESRFNLANGSEIAVDTTYTTVEYNSQKKEVAVVFMGDSEALVGVEFLDQMRFCLDLKNYEAELNF